MQDYTPLLNNIRRYVHLEPKAQEAFISIIRTVTISKKELLVTPGFICSCQSYVYKGALRAYLVDHKGDDHTVQLAIEDWFISDFYSYITQTPATLVVEAVEDATLFQIEYHAVEELCREFSEFEHYFRVVAQKAFAFSQRRILSNLGQSAEDRYREFAHLYPTMLQRFPQYALASYLGMSAEFLSKIRKRIVRDE